MARKTTSPDTQVFKKHQKVAAARDLPGVPAGTPGKVLMLGGFTWVRYRVRFDNGAERGMLNADDLVTAAEAAEQQRQAEAAARKAQRDAERAALRDRALASEARGASGGAA
jgi:hypothetical protein